MNDLRKVAFATLQITTAIGSMASPAVAHNQEAAQRMPTQAEINQASLKSIEQSWMNVPRVCKAAGFNAQPVPLSVEARSQSVSAIYSNFGA